MIRSYFLAAVFVALAPFALAARDEKPVASTEPKDVPLELKLVADQADWELDSRGDPSFKFQEKIRAGEKSGEPVSATRVNLELEIKNTGKQPLRIWVSGDATLLSLDLTGPGAMTAAAKLTPPTGVDPPHSVTLAPGKSYKIPLSSLAYGFRLSATHAYITETGDYQLSATFKTGVSPAPPNSKGLTLGFGEVTLKSAPIAFFVKRPS